MKWHKKFDIVIQLPILVSETFLEIEVNFLVRDISTICRHFLCEIMFCTCAVQFTSISGQFSQVNIEKYTTTISQNRLCLMGTDKIILQLE